MKTYCGLLMMHIPFRRRFSDKTMSSSMLLQTYCFGWDISYFLGGGRVMWEITSCWRSHNTCNSSDIDNYDDLRGFYWCFDHKIL